MLPVIDCTSRVSCLEMGYMLRMRTEETRYSETKHTNVKVDSRIQISKQGRKKRQRTFLALLPS